MIRTAVHAYTAVWPISPIIAHGRFIWGTTHGNAHFATSHNPSDLAGGSNMLSTTHPAMERFYTRRELAAELRAWRREAQRPDSGFTLTRETVGVI